LFTGVRARLTFFLVRKDVSLGYTSTEKKRRTQLPFHANFNQTYYFPQYPEFSCYQYNLHSSGL